MVNEKISVFIVVYNEEKKIERCLKSVSWADEIIIVDSYSRDKTVEICKKYTDKIYQRPFTDFAEMKNYAISQASGEWLLGVDADEEITEALREKIKLIINKNIHDVSGFYIKRKSYIFGKWFRFCGTQDDFQLRLFKKATAYYFQPIHERVALTGKKAYIRECLLHYTYKNITEYMQRLNKYTSMEAEFLKSKGRKPSRSIFLLKPFMRFLELYIIKQGFRDGMEGFLFGALSGFYDFVKYAKLRQVLKPEK
ncbi:MAG: glycosyltransferase family 2 protein [Candidatus Omnitrophota bacterium]|jgi:glycosyltransferase involved in cell wall biosynthesis